jgi:protein SCO1/2
MMRWLVCGVTVGVALSLLHSCQSTSSLDSSRLVATNGRHYEFPADLRGHVVVVSFIYTHCPDICRMTIGRMLELWGTVGPDSGVVFATVTLDPVRDTLGALREYASAWGIPSERWLLLTGTIADVERVHRAFGIIARKSYTERLPSGEDVYFIDHTDAVFLLDRNGTIRDRREGSTLDVERYAALVHQYLQDQ